MKKTDTSGTSEFVLKSQSAGFRPSRFPPVPDVEVFGLSHQGLVRTKNEDHFLVCRFGRQLEILQSTLRDLDFKKQLDETCYAMVVADGMGGHSAGEVASQMAIHSLLDLVVSTPDWIFHSDDGQLSQEIARRFRIRSVEVNQKLLDAVESDPDLRGFGTTMTAAWNLGQDLFIANIGDSRAYLLRGNQLHQLTTDHTLAQGLVDRGVLSSEDATIHRLRHVLTKYLGGDGQSFEPDIQKIILEDGDRLLLCTDGLSEMVSSDAISATMKRNESAEHDCQHLVEKALAAGGKDNITVVVARYQIDSNEPVTRESRR